MPLLAKIIILYVTYGYNINLPLRLKTRVFFNTKPFFLAFVENKSLKDYKGYTLTEKI